MFDFKTELANLQTIHQN